MIIKIGLAVSAVLCPEGIFVSWEIPDKIR